MILLIDAYNLLKQLFGQEISKRQRVTYIRNLNAYAKIKHHSIVLVFDGGFFDYPIREKQGSVLSIDAGKNRTADELIMEYIDKHKAKDMVLVSSDRELINYASKHDIVAVDSRVFDRYVQQALEKPQEQMVPTSQKAHKIHPEYNDEELDALMQEASQMVVQKPEDDTTNKQVSRRKSSKLSKKERKIMAKLKKL